jgi:hypothetical protein
VLAVEAANPVMVSALTAASAAIRPCFFVKCPPARLVRLCQQVGAAKGAD